MISTNWDNADNVEHGVIIEGGTFDSVGIHFRTVNTSTA